MKTLFRYISKQLLVVTLLVTVILCMVFWLAKAPTLLDFILNRGLNVGIFLYMSLLIIPRLLLLLLPIAAFCTILFAYYKLSADSELVAMRAAGSSTLYLAKPALAVGFILTLVMMFLTLYVLPASYREYKDQEHHFRQHFGSAILQEGAFNNVADGITVFIHSRGEDQELRGIMVHDNRNPEKPQTWLAERGTLVATKDGPRAILVNGNSQQVDRVRGKFGLLLFDQSTVDFGAAMAENTNRWREPRERFLHELFDPKDTPNAGPHKPFYKDLIAEGHYRLVTPLLPLTFAAITAAIMLTGSYSRRGQMADIIKAVVVMALIFSASFATRSLAGKQPIMILAMYANVAIPFAISIYFILRPRKLRPSWFTRRALKKAKAA